MEQKFIQISKNIATLRVWSNSLKQNTIALINAGFLANGTDQSCRDLVLIAERITNLQCEAIALKQQGLADKLEITTHKQVSQSR